MHPLVSLLVFVVFSLLGYHVIKRVPTLLHTPLMSGMNAFSGVTILGCITATATASILGSRLLGMLAIILAMINVVGGFAVTDRMLQMFRPKKKSKSEGGPKA